MEYFHLINLDKKLFFPNYFLFLFSLILSFSENDYLPCISHNQNHKLVLYDKIRQSRIDLQGLFWAKDFSEKKSMARLLYFVFVCLFLNSFKAFNASLKSLIKFYKVLNHICMLKMRAFN